MSGELAEFAHSAHAAFQERGVAGWAEHWTEDVVLDFRPARVPGVSIYRGKEEAWRFCEEWIGTFEDWTDEILDVEELSDEVVSIRWRQTGRARGSEAPVTLDYTQICRVEHGLWKELTVYLDPDEARRAAAELIGGSKASPAGRIVGVGGVFRRSDDPDALRAFYVERLGLPLRGDTGMLEDEGGITVVGFFDRDTEYFGPARQEAMFNFRVDDLDALLARLREEGVEVDEEKGVEDMEGIGRFAWITDPEGNRVELWEPAG